METTTNNEVAIIENSLEVIKNGPQILLANRERTRKAIEVGKNILEAIKANGGVMTPEHDQRAMNYLVNVGKALKEMKEGRAEVTQIMDELKKMFTKLENDLDLKKSDTIPAQIQIQRDAYAKQVFEEQERKRRAAELIAAKAKESIEIKNTIEVRLSTYFNDFLLRQKQKFNDGYNNLVLDTFADDAAGIRLYEPKYPERHFNEFDAKLYSGIHSAEELTALKEEVLVGKYDKLNDQYVAEMTDLKREIVDKLHSKFEELKEAARLAKEAAEEAERQKAAEKLRQEEYAKALAKSVEADKLRILKEEQRIEREQEAIRLKELEAEKAKQDAIKKQRQLEEALQLAKDAELAKAKAEQEAEIKKQGEQTLVMFEQEAAVAEVANTTESRQGFDIEVTHAAGFVQIFQYWFENEGKKLPVAKIGNTKLDQMKAYCEKVAHATGEKIESKFIIYTPSFKAINRKAK